MRTRSLFQYLSGLLAYQQGLCRIGKSNSLCRKSVEDFEINLLLYIHVLNII